MPDAPLAAAPPAAGRMPGGATPIFLDQNANTFVGQQQQQQRASLSSLMFMTFFFFMMSGGSPPMTLDEYQEKSELRAWGLGGLQETRGGPMLIRGACVALHVY